MVSSAEFRQRLRVVLVKRIEFIRLVGGGVVAAAALPMSGCSLSSDFPDQAAEAWTVPPKESDPRRCALAYAIGSRGAPG